MITARYFSEREFQRCDPPCSLQDMEQGLMDMLDDVRARAGIPIVLNCAYRSRAHDLAKGRSGNSAHTRGRAVDVRCNTSATRFKIVKSALAAGFTRIGIAKTFVHLDNDNTLTQHIIFDYYG